MSTLTGVTEALKELTPGSELVVRLGKVGYDLETRSIKTPSKGSTGGGSKAKHILDTETGLEYKSMTACGYALIDLVREKVKPGSENWAFYALQKTFPGRFVEKTS